MKMVQADAAIKMWDKAPGFSVKFTDMVSHLSRGISLDRSGNPVLTSRAQVIGKLSDLNGKPDIVGFVLDTEFKSPAAMQGHIDGMLKGVSNGLMMNYGAANAVSLADANACEFSSCWGLKLAGISPIGHRGRADADDVLLGYVCRRLRAPSFHSAASCSFPSVNRHGTLTYLLSPV